MSKLPSGVMPLNRAAPPETFQAKVERKTREAAEMYEKLFLREMVKSMRKTVDTSGLVRKNMGEKIFSEKLDAEYVENWGKRGGIGLSEIIYTQIMERFGQQMGISPKAIAKPQGPVPLSKSKNYLIERSSSTPNSMSYMVKSPEGAGKTQILNPWPGLLLNSQFLESGSSLYTIQHDNGFVSKFALKGQLEAEPGQRLSAGEPFARLTSGRDYAWQIDASQVR